MQLVALRENGSVILSHQAVKGVDYYCSECRGTVRLRGGIHRRNHFYHIAKSSQCRLNGKSMKHLQVQWTIQNTLPPNEASLEKQFPEIQRIADVCWERERIVFEVQCSPISKEEVLARNRDYKSLGYDVIWILHDQRFNKRKVAAAEDALQHSTFYYTNIDIDGEGKIYDQISVIRKGIKVRRFKSFFVDISNPQRDIGVSDFGSKKNLFFAGDTMDRLVKGELQESELIEFTENKSNPLKGVWLLGIMDRMTSMYQHLFRIILERSCQ